MASSTPASFLQEFSSRRGDVSSKLNMKSMDETALVSPGLPGTEEKQLGLCIFFPNLKLQQQPRAGHRPLENEVSGVGSGRGLQNFQDLCASNCFQALHLP